MSKRTIITLVAAVALLIVVLNSLFIVKEGEFKVVLKFGEAVRVEGTPGLKFKVPFVENTTTLPKNQMIFDSQAAQILTNDKKPILVDNYTVWRITDVEKFLRTVQTVKAGEQVIDNAVFNTVRRKLSEIAYDNIISEETERGDLNEEITKEVYDFLSGDYGVTIIDVRIKRTDLPPENKDSVYNRMISDRQSIAARYLSEGDEESKRITAKADREAVELIAQSQSDAKKIVAEGEEQAAKIYNDSYGKDPEFYRIYRTLQSYTTTLNNEPVIMLPIDSPYAQILLGNE